MNLKDLQAHFIEDLSGIYEAGEATVIFDLLLKHVSGFNNRQLALKGINTLVQDEFTLLNYLTELKTGKPVQYIIGETEFYGLRFKVNPDVLIPRPETEELVEWVLESCRSAVQVIDIGTGSGCIAIALSKNIVGARVTGLDVSAKALEMAAANALLNDVDVNFVQADILDYGYFSKDNRLYDVIVSNPPYITPKEATQMHRNVLDHEPHLALFAQAEKPLIFYESIADFALTHLTSNGLLFFEINEHLAEFTIQMLKDKSFTNIYLKKDMQGKDRMIRCSLGS